MVRNMNLKNANVAQSWDLVLDGTIWHQPTGSVRLSYVAPLHSAGRGAEDPEEQSQARCGWWHLISFRERHSGGCWRVCVGRRGRCGEEGAALTRGTSDQRHSAIRSFLRGAFWAATCELVVNTDKQAKLKVRSVRTCLFTHHTYLCVCSCTSTRRPGFSLSSSSPFAMRVSPPCSAQLLWTRSMAP